MKKSIDIYGDIIKRSLDTLISLVALITLSPIFMVLTLCLCAANNGSPFFIQPRPGRGERIFNLIKFKTMNDNKDGNGRLLSDRERITPVGRFVRSWSLDELPQLINVLIGDMSLIGPRPLLVQYLPLYNEYQKRRHEVRPGITGWAQVNGRNAIGWEERFKMDVWYVEHVSLSLDLKIVIQTLYKILSRDGINQSAGKTMLPFTGNK